MTCAIITSTTTRVDIELNGCAEDFGYSHLSFAKSALLRLELDTSSDTVRIIFNGGTIWRCSHCDYTGSKVLLVESVDSVEITTSLELFDALRGMM